MRFTVIYVIKLCQLLLTAVAFKMKPNGNYS